MQQQDNKFKKITQEFGSTSVSKSFEANGLIGGDTFTVSGTLDNIDVNTDVRTTGVIKAFGQQFPDGLYEFYRIQDYREFYIQSPDNYYLYDHSQNTNVFRQFISTDASIMSKYAVRLYDGWIFGKYFNRNEIPGDFTGGIYVTNSIWDNSTTNFANLSGSSAKIYHLGDNILPPVDNRAFGKANVSDIYFNNQYSIPSLRDEVHYFDVIYTLEFKRILA